MNIILMRHGEAIPFAASDSERSLTPNGIAEVTKTSSLLMEGGWVPKAVFCSTRLRAEQTACRVIESMSLSSTPQIINGITPEEEWSSALKIIAANASDGSLFVFHQPILTKIVGYLIESNPHVDIHPRAVVGVAYVLSVCDFLPGEATILSSYTP